MAFIVGTQSQDEFFMGRMLAMWLPLCLLISPSVYFTLLGAPQFRIYASVRAHKWQQGVLAPEEHCSSTKLSYCQMQSTPNLSRTSTKTAHRAQSSPKYEHNVRLRAEQISPESPVKGEAPHNPHPDHDGRSTEGINYSPKQSSVARDNRLMSETEREGTRSSSH